MADSLSLSNTPKGTWVHAEGKTLGFTAVVNIDDDGVERVYFYVSSGADRKPGTELCEDVGKFTIEDLEEMAETRKRELNAKLAEHGKDA